jgi:hypothetical protein
VVIKEQNPSVKPSHRLIQILCGTTIQVRTLGHDFESRLHPQKRRKTDESRGTISFCGNPPPVMAPNINVLDLGVVRLRYLVEVFWNGLDGDTSSPTPNDNYECDNREVEFCRRSRKYYWPSDSLDCEAWSLESEILVLQWNHL